jgi:hypothetical protein
MRLKRQVSLSGLTPDDYRAMSFDQATMIRNNLIAQEKEKEAAYFWNNWESVHQNDQREDALAEQNKDPNYLAQGATSGGGALLNGAGGAIGAGAVNAMMSEGGAGAGAGGTTAGASGADAMVLPSTLDWSVAGVAPEAGGGATGASATGTTGATSGASSAGSGTSLSGIAGSVAPAAATAYGLYRMYQTANKVRPRHGQVASGFHQGFDEGMKPANLAAFGMIGGPLWSGLYGSAASMWGSGKGEEQLNRDLLRDNMHNGWIDDNHQMQFSDGGSFDFGIDGGAMLNNIGTEGMPGNQRHYYDVDWSDPNAGQLVGDINPLALALSFDEKTQADLVGEFYNGAIAGKDPQSRIADYYNKLPGQSAMDKRNFIYENVQNAYKEGRITESERNAYLAGIDAHFGVKNPNQGKGGEAEFGSNYITPGKENNFIDGSIKIPDVTPTIEAPASQSLWKSLVANEQPLFGNDNDEDMSWINIGNYDRNQSQAAVNTAARNRNKNNNPWLK